ncbi:MAG: hypothetical protein GWO05_00455, partial [Gammaproteobacteria bacterium]|nr:hypothetical protein [Gammaproteobacteria bacterium]
SLGFVLTNTFADLTNHTVIDMVRMPALSDDPIPPVTDGPGMDLESWESELDRITGTVRQR